MYTQIAAVRFIVLHVLAEQKLYIKHKAVKSVLEVELFKAFSLL